MRIPGRVIINSDGNLESTKFDSTQFNHNIPTEHLPFLACKKLLYNLLAASEFQDDSEGHVITQPHLTTRLKYPSDEIHLVYRSDILVSPDFPERISRLGRDLITLSLHECSSHLTEPSAKDWVNIALLSPKDITTVDYTEQKTISRLTVDQNPVRSDWLNRRMINAYAS